ncbi:MAG TPA: alpha-glucan family phosphorylase, partial [Candidatus Brocadiia bacterium]|nr:alpha-glucan family phosphorylase [Candidatus Brocadiia bacterium]
MRIVRQFNVTANLPEPLEPLRRIAFNLWWCWRHDAIALFRRLDPERWELCEHNPVRMLGETDQARLNAMAEDDGYLAHVARVSEALDAYLASPRRYADRTGGGTIAYFSAEFGLSECVPIYSGGLGMLAGDHLKAASDLGLPLVGVGLLYREGYFRQYLNPDGWQGEIYPRNDFYNMPITKARNASGQPVVFDFRHYPQRVVRVQVWQVEVGRVPLYLLDTNLLENDPADRDITAQLYGGDWEMRLRQEMMLGIGGMQALQALGIQPAVCHMNEGHSAFLAVERCRMLMKQTGCSFNEAREAVYAGACFTTHTPVPAGNDAFHPGLIEKYLAPYIRDLGLTFEEFMALGRQNPANTQEEFCVTVLALKLASFRNGVSRLHSEVSSKMWRNIWPSVPLAEVPITSITNGVHTSTWISHDMAGLLDQYLGPRWLSAPADPIVWARVDQIPDAELWRTHERRRERLVAFVRQRVRRQLMRRGAPPREIEQAEEILDPDALTIGFARRFAGYKRATLLFHDVERLTRILCNTDRPVQIIYAGKAHPRDNEGKELIRRIVHMVRRPELRRHVAFVEDYDMNVARYLVQGCDVWLNTPLRPMEASGTSGMKATANGALNISIPDGWWAEAARQDNGWTIGRGEQYSSFEEQNAVESAAIYDILEKEVAPMFYERGADDLPRQWVRYMKNALRSVCPIFNTHRMVQQYTEWAYVPAMERWRRMTDSNLALARQVAQWRGRMAANWPKTRILSVDAAGKDEVKVGDRLEVSARIDLGQAEPDDVRVEIYFGGVDVENNLVRPRTTTMKCEGRGADGVYTFRGQVQFRASGQ